MRQAGVLIGVLALLGAGATVFAIRTGGADAETERTSSATIALGRTVYAEQCASCHGENLEGQPDWKRRLPSGRLPAPPHDDSGHTWHHGDGVLFRITKEGPAAVVGDGYESDMPGFRHVLSDDEIRAALEFIKSTWSDRARQVQAAATEREDERKPDNVE